MSKENKNKLMNIVYCKCEPTFINNYMSTLSKEMSTPIKRSTTNYNVNWLRSASNGD